MELFLIYFVSFLCGCVNIFLSFTFNTNVMAFDFDGRVILMTLSPIWLMAGMFIHQEIAKCWRQMN